MITEKVENIPVDLEEILSIFNRIIANWISKYDECVWSRYSSKHEVITIPTEDNGSIVLYENYTWKIRTPESVEAEKIENKN